MEAEQKQYTIFQVIELARSQNKHVQSDPGIANSTESCDQEFCDQESQSDQDDLYQFVLCVKNLHKPTLRQIDQQRVDLTYWLSSYFGRYIPTAFLLPIIDVDMAASSLSIFLPRVDIHAVNASLEDVYNFLKNISPLIDVPIEIIDEWRQQHKRLRIYHQQYVWMPNYMDQDMPNYLKQQEDGW